jgi:hypothetical protein
MSKEYTLEELTKEVENLEKNIDRIPSDSCERTVLLVFKHKEVRDAFLKLLLQGYDFFNYECRDIGFDPGKIFKVTLYFRCRPPKICIVHPRLEIHYDRPNDKILEIREAFTS